jgi:hypothetical protein
VKNKASPALDFSQPETGPEEAKVNNVLILRAKQQKLSGLFPKAMFRFLVLDVNHNKSFTYRINLSFNLFRMLHVGYKSTSSRPRMKRFLDLDLPPSEPDFDSALAQQIKHDFRDFLGSIDLDITTSSFSFAGDFITFLKCSQPTDLPELIHSYPVLPFFANYFQFLTSVSNFPSEDPFPRKQFQKGCRALSLLLKQRCISPSDLLSIPGFLRSLERLLDSNWPEIEAGLSFFFSSCLTRDDAPDSIIALFFPRALNCRFCFETQIARQLSLRFLRRLLRFVPSFASIVFDEINASLFDLLRDSEAPVLHPDVIKTLFTELSFHPDSWPSCGPILNFSMVLLHSVDDKELRAIWRLLSLIVTSEVFPVESFASRIDFGGIVVEMNSNVPGMSTAALELVVDIAARGPLFVDALATAGLFGLVGENWETFSWRDKEKVYQLCGNVLITGEPEHVLGLIGDKFFRRLLEEADVLEAETRIKFLEGFARAVERIDRGWHEAVCAVFQNNGIQEIIASLSVEDDEMVAVIAERLIAGLNIGS